MRAEAGRCRWLVWLAAVVVLVLGVWPAVGWSAHPFLHNGPGGTLAPGDPEGGNRFREEIPTGGGSGDYLFPQQSSDPAAAEVPVSPAVIVPPLPVGVSGHGVMLPVPLWRRPGTTAFIEVDISPKRIQ